MLVVFSLISVAGTKIIFGYNFVAPIRWQDQLYLTYLIFEI